MSYLKADYVAGERESQARNFLSHNRFIQEQIYKRQIRLLTQLVHGELELSGLSEHIEGMAGALDS